MSIINMSKRKVVKTLRNSTCVAARTLLHDEKSRNYAPNAGDRCTFNRRVSNSTNLSHALRMWMTLYSDNRSPIVLFILANS